MNNYKETCSLINCYIIMFKEIICLLFCLYLRYFICIIICFANNFIYGFCTNYTEVYIIYTDCINNNYVEILLDHHTLFLKHIMTLLCILLTIFVLTYCISFTLFISLFFFNIILKMILKNLLLFAITILLWCLHDSDKFMS